MRTKIRPKIRRITAACLAAVLSCSSVYTSVAFAADGWTESQVPGTPALQLLRDYTFSADANAQATAAGQVVTGLSHEYTFTHKLNGGKEPFAYGKWWLGNYRGQAVKDAKVPLSSDRSKTVTVDFSKLANHYLSCIQMHNAVMPGTQMIPPKNGLPHLSIFSGQFFAYEAYTPTTNPLDYPEYIRNKMSDVNAMKFYLLLMTRIHGYEVKGGESALKDDRAETAYSMIIFELTRCLEEGYFTGMPTTADADWAKIASRTQGDLSQFYDAALVDNATNNDMKRWFTICWNQAWFMSQFTYAVSDDSKLTVSLPLGAAYIGTDGKYHRSWDYNSVLTQNPQVMLYNMGINLKSGSKLPDGVTFTNEGGKLDFSASTAEALDDTMFKGVSFTSSTLGGTSEIQPGGIINGRSAHVSINADSIQADNTGQPMFASFMVDVELVVGTQEPSTPTPSPGPDDDSEEVVRYKHTETFASDYVINLRKFDSETGQPLADSHFDILEAFPDADGQLGATVLESEENWQNDNGSQFNKWTGWDAGQGNEDASSGGTDPCTLDDNVTNEDGLLTYGGSGDTAHSDRKTYTYVKGYCGGHPAKPEPEYDDDGNLENGDEIEKWENGVAKCEALIHESNTGYFCATAEKGYEGGEDSDGHESKKEMEDDRDKFYADFISLTYDYSAKEIKARPGYILHDTHTDDIPIETKTVTSSQWKDYNSSYSGDVTQLPHQATAAAGGTGTGGTGGGGDDGDTDEEALFSAALTNESEDAVSGKSRKHLQVSTASNAESRDDLDDEDVENTLEEAQEETAETENRYLTFLNTLPEADESLNAEEADADEADAEIPDGDLVDDIGTGQTEKKAVIATSSNAQGEMLATPSNADHTAAKESFLIILYENVRSIARHFYDMLREAAEKAIALFAGDEKDAAASHPERDSVSWLDDTNGNYIKPLQDDIVDHTFTVFDHRTEGEIHINKQDYDLQSAAAKEENKDTYDAYAEENGDGTLEGAVYGLFAAQDLEHPDGHTGTVYQQDDLVAVATTDRNGDASFMAFTEAPGSTYDYEQGAIVKRTDAPFDGPENLHKPQADGDAAAEDNETYIGHDSKNQEVTIEDSEDGDATVYYKHSSNQDGPEGLTGGHEVYPILNNEENNGNCWIGRPLLADASGSQYYVKELSRSEGYELSVTGKTGFITNGAGSNEITTSNMDIKVGTPSYNSEKNALNLDVTGTNVDRDVTISVKTQEGATFASMVKHMEEYEETERVQETVEKPLIPAAGTRVTLNGSSVEATVGETITVNGIPYTVTQVSDPVVEAIGVQPANANIYGVVEKTTLGTSNLTDFQTAFNDELHDLGYKTPDAEAPWIRVPMTGSSDTDWLGAINTAMADQGIIFFNGVRLTDFVTENGVTYAVIRYDHATKKQVDDCVYNTERDSLFVKRDTGKGYFVYVEVPLTSDLVLSVNRNESGFVTNASLKQFAITCNTEYPGSLPNSYGIRVPNPKTFWVYDGTMQMFTNNGELATYTDFVWKDQKVTRTREVETLTDLPFQYDNGVYTVTIPKNLFLTDSTVHVTIRSDGQGSFSAAIASLSTTATWMPGDAGEDSYLRYITLTYPDEDTVYESNSTEESPISVSERSLRQKIRIDKDIQKLKESKVVWYCLNCGYENEDGVDECAYCHHARTTEENKTIDYPESSFP